MRHTPTFTRVAIVSKIDKDIAKIAIAEAHRPLHVNYGGLPSEDEIALANINKRKSETEEKREAQRKKTQVKQAQRVSQRSRHHHLYR